MIPNCKDIGYKTCSDYSVMFGNNKTRKRWSSNHREFNI